MQLDQHEKSDWREGTAGSPSAISSIGIRRGSYEDLRTAHKLENGREAV